MYSLGEIQPETLPLLAAEALEAGYDSQSLRELAGTSSADTDAIMALFPKALTELGLRAPSPPDAGLMLARSIADDIVEGRIVPYEGARRIWWKVFTRFPQLTQLTPFVGMASEYEDDKTHRSEYSQLIVDEAKKLLAGDHD
jgi:hypothetical protein